MSIQKKSLISTLKTAKKANVASAATKEQGNAVRTAGAKRFASAERLASGKRFASSKRFGSGKR